MMPSLTSASSFCVRKSVDCAKPVGRIFKLLSAVRHFVSVAPNSRRHTALKHLRARIGEPSTPTLGTSKSSPQKLDSRLGDLASSQGLSSPHERFPSLMFDFPVPETASVKTLLS